MWHVLRYPAFDDFRSQTQWLRAFERPEQAETYIHKLIAAGEMTLRDYGIVKTHEAMITCPNCRAPWKTNEARP